MVVVLSMLRRAPFWSYFDHIILAMGEMFQVLWHLGVPLTMFYFFCSNWALGLMGVAPDVREMAASYARIRGVFQPVLLDLTIDCCMPCCTELATSRLCDRQKHTKTRSCMVLYESLWCGTWQVPFFGRGVPPLHTWFNVNSLRITNCFAGKCILHKQLYLVQMSCDFVWMPTCDSYWYWVYVARKSLDRPCGLGVAGPGCLPLCNLSHTGCSHPVEGGVRSCSDLSVSVQLRTCELLKWRATNHFLAK